VKGGGGRVHRADQRCRAKWKAKGEGKTIAKMGNQGVGGTLGKKEGSEENN